MATIHQRRSNQNKRLSGTSSSPGMNPARTPTKDTSSHHHPHMSVAGTTISAPRPQHPRASASFNPRSVPVGQGRGVSLRSFDDDEVHACEFMKEALCTFVWAISACLLRGFVELIFSLKDLSDWSSDKTFIVRFPLGAISSCISFVESCLPQKFRAGFALASGFIFAAPILLLLLKQHFGVMPNLPIRICEMIMGRLAPRELALLVPVHFLAAVAGTFALKLFLPGVVASHTLAPIVYSEDESYLLNLLRETAVTSAFCVGLLVIPVLLHLNKMPVFLFSTLILSPLYLISVDIHTEMASSFSPDLIYALRCVSRHEEMPLRQSGHLFGPMIGGAIAGYIMATYFPDDRSPYHYNAKQNKVGNGFSK
eukprot:CAMPEP_0116063438 /NCGR_PEP_ID=MMETSP0322-20121206/8422_1 /TAXON_ID=163516 /ORGANISM="Leptocylindrus danicus var. apora, Strain B651" /LENGTH=367 /DNA_ID=CAMNT_0003549071 /DNA_START=271 /DNA_END=1374 /DNA_ORIENTATION=+